MLEAEVIYVFNYPHYERRLWNFNDTNIITSLNLTETKIKCSLLSSIQSPRYNAIVPRPHAISVQWYPIEILCISI